MYLVFHPTTDRYYKYHIKFVPSIVWSASPKKVALPPNLPTLLSFSSLHSSFHFPNHPTNLNTIFQRNRNTLLRSFISSQKIFLWLTEEFASKMNILGHHCDAFRMDGSKVTGLKHGYQVCLGSSVKGKH